MTPNNDIKIDQSINLVADDDPRDEVGLRVGATIDEFNIETLIGRGGASEVYKALDTRTQSTVAIKFLLPSRLGDKQAAARLRNEAKHIMSLRHRRIVSVLDVRDNDAVGPYIVMELISGEPLLTKLPLPESESLEICSQIAEGLAYAHSKGMIHRDIKPTNVMVLEDGSIKLVDFGLAKALSEENRAHIPLTRTSEVVGTSLYMSPEQCFGHEVDARTDTYQLGCLLYQCITGFPPFEASTSFEAMFKHVSVEPDLKDVSESLRGLIRKAMDKNPDQRFQSAAEIGSAFQDAKTGKKVAHGAAKSQWVRPLRLAATCLASAAVSFIVITSLLTHSPSLSPPLTGAQARAQVLYEQGVEYKARGWTEKARESLSQAMKLDNGPIGFKASCFLRARLPAHFQTEDAEQMNIRAYNLDFAGRKQEAESVWLKCIEKYPNFEWPYSNLGGQYHEDGKIQKAIPLLEKAIDINPYYTNALRNLSAAEADLGNMDLAIKYMQRASDSLPDDASLKKELAELERKRR